MTWCGWRGGRSGAGAVPRHERFFVLPSSGAATRSSGSPPVAGAQAHPIKQSAEFGIQTGGQKIAGLLFLIHDVHGVGLAAAQGVLLTEPFYWNLNGGTCAGFAKRFAALMPGNVRDRCMPASIR